MLARTTTLLLTTTALLGACMAAPALAETITLDPLKVEDGAPAAAAVVDGYQAKRTTTATKTDTPLLDVPQSVSVITKEAMEDQAVRSIGDVLRYTPGVTVAQGEGNRDTIVIRGNSSTADFFSNGVRDDSQVFRDMYNVDRVEVLKGANAMVFGRGGGGGVVNRVMKQADGSPVRQVTVQGGMFNTKRASADVGQAINSNVAVRVNGMVEDSDSFRDEVGLQRQGFNPTMTLKAGDKTDVKLSYEFFRDDRTADRGIPSLGTRPFKTDRSTFFGNPDQSNAENEQHTLDATIEHRIQTGLTLTNKTRFQATDKYYENVYANSSASGNSVALAAYSNGHERENLFNQTDLVTDFTTGQVKHKLLTGIELGRQNTDSLRRTGYFNNASRSLTVSALNPTSHVPVTFRHRETDADGSTTVTVQSAYAQDQIDLTEQWQVIGGMRFDKYDLDYTNNKTGQEISREDNLWSPRLGVVFKPVKPVSIYSSYSVSYLPSSGDQFTSITASQATLKPEQYTNLELGAKWDVRPDLSLTTALFQLDRKNNIATNPANTATSLQMGTQRTRGFEFGASGKITPEWQVTGGYAYQDASYIEATSQVPEGRAIAMVPAHTFTLWNKYDFNQTWAAGLGMIYQGESPTSSSNTVYLPGYTRFDAAVYANINESVRAQLNVQNLLDREYYVNAHSNNNISPGAPRTVMLTLISDF